jgi:glycosyltransferase involved in cell wall biosynthesis
MRIAFVNTFYEPTIGGVEKVIEELAVRYVKQGHEVHVFCCDSDKHIRIKKKYEVINGVHVHRSRYWFRLSLYTFVFPGLIAKLLWHKFDVVHSHVSAHDHVLFAGLIARLKHRAHVHTTHCPWTDKFRPLAVRIPLWFAHNFINYPSFYLCDKVIAITPWEIPQLKKWVSEKRIEVIPNGMDQVLFEKIKNNGFRAKLGISRTSKVVLFFGRFHANKAPHVLAHVAVEVLKERHDVDFVFVGPDEGELEHVKSIVKGLKRVHVIGPLFGKKNIAEMFQAATVCVLPSYREGLPLTLFEAMASGLPVVATPCNGIPYEMEDGVNGFLVPFDDRVLMKKRIYEVIDDKKLAKRMGDINKKKVRDYTWDAIADRTMDVYKQEISKKWF